MTEVAIALAECHGGEVTLGRLLVELRAVDERISSVAIVDDSVVASSTELLAPAEAERVREALAVHQNDVLRLATAKREKLLAIDARTTQLIELGFVFQGHRCSLSLAAQSKLIGLETLRSDPMMAYPIAYNSLDDSEAFMLPDASAVHAIFLTAADTLRARIDSGTALKNAVRAATSYEDCMAIVDLR